MHCKISVGTQTSYHAYYSQGGVEMAFRNVTIVDGKKVDLKDLDEKDRKRLAEELCRRLADKLGYTEAKTAK